MARQKWEQILGALFHGAQSALPLYFQMMEQREAEAAQAQAEEEAKAEDQQKVQDILAIMAPVLGTTFPEKGYSMLGPEAVPGGQPIYPEGGVPTQAALSLFGRAESGDMDPGWLMYLINLLEGRGGMYEPAPEPEQPINPETLAMIGELMGITGTRPFGYGPQEVRGFGEALDQDWGREVELAMQQPDILRSLFEAPEAGPDEADRIAAMVLEGLGMELPEGADPSELLDAQRLIAGLTPQPAEPRYFGGPSTGIYEIGPGGEGWRLPPPPETPREGMRTDRHNNPTAMIVEFAQMLGGVEGVDYVRGDPFTGSDDRTYYTARLLGDGMETSIKLFDQGAQNGRNVFSWWNGISDQQWLAKDHDEKVAYVNSIYQMEGGANVRTGFQGIRQPTTEAVEWTELPESERRSLWTAAGGTIRPEDASFPIDEDNPEVWTHAPGMTDAETKETGLRLRQEGTAAAEPMSEEQWLARVQDVWERIKEDLGAAGHPDPSNPTWEEIDQILVAYVDAGIISSKDRARVSNWWLGQH